MAYELLGPDGRPIPPEQRFLLGADGVPYTPESTRDFALPATLTVSSIISGANKTYLAAQFDEALRHSRENALTMWRDCRIHGWLNERVESVINLKWHLKVPNEKDPAQKAVKDGLTIALQRTPRLKKIFRSLFKWGLWTGRGASHQCWRWEEMDLPALEEKNIFQQMEEDLHAGINGKSQMNGQMNGTPPPEEETPMQRRRVLIAFKNRPVNGDKINYSWGWSESGKTPPGTPLVRVYGAIGSEIDETEVEVIYDNLGPTIALTGPWRERFIIHGCDHDDADYFEPENAGGIYGVGIRSRIYWLNWIRMDYAAWIGDLFDRVGLGFICIKYDMSSKQAKDKAEEAAKRWNRRSVLAIPVTPDQLQKAGSIEVVEVPTTGAVVVQELVKYCDKAIERFILRQTMSSGGSSEGDGVRGTVGPAQMAKNTETQRIKSDAEELAETITGSDDEPGLISVMKKWTYPGADFPVWFEFDVEDVSPKEKLQAVTMAAGLGCTFIMDEVRKLTGMTKPGPHDQLCQKQMGAVGGAAGGIPGSEEEEGGEGGDDTSASETAAREWLSSGKTPGTLEEIAQRHSITRQALSQSAKRIEVGGGT